MYIYIRRMGTRERMKKTLRAQMQKSNPLADNGSFLSTELTMFENGTDRDLGLYCTEFLGDGMGSITLLYLFFLSISLSKVAYMLSVCIHICMYVNVQYSFFIHPYSAL